MTTQAELLVDVNRIVQDDSYDEAEQLSFLNQAMKEIAGGNHVDRNGNVYDILLPDLETQDDVTTSTSVSYVSLPSDYQKKLFYCYNSTKYWPIKIYPSLWSLQRMFSKLDQGGAIVGVAIRADELHYQRIPSSAETLQLHYYRKPYDMATYTSNTISFNVDGDDYTIEDSESGLGDFYAGQVIDVTGSDDNNTNFTITAADADSLTVASLTAEEAGSEVTIKSRPDGFPDHLVKPLLVFHACAEIFAEIEQDLKGAKVNTSFYLGKLEKTMMQLIRFLGPPADAPNRVEQEICWEDYL